MVGVEKVCQDSMVWGKGGERWGMYQGCEQKGQRDVYRKGIVAIEGVTSR